MKPIHEILNKIKWDEKEDPDEYVIGYWDRIEDKIIEMPLKEFLKKDIPLHRIRHLKKKNEIVWIRKDKF